MLFLGPSALLLGLFAPAGGAEELLLRVDQLAYLLVAAVLLAVHVHPLPTQVAHHPRAAVVEVVLVLDVDLLAVKAELRLLEGLCALRTEQQLVALSIPQGTQSPRPLAPNAELVLAALRLP